MSVSNGQVANATTFNNAFVSKTATSGNIVTGIVAMANVTDVNSGASFTNTQRYINETADSDGTVGIGDATRKTYSSNTVVSNGDSRKIAIGKLDERFDGTTGHIHDGTSGEGPMVSASNLDDFNKYWAVRQTFSVSPGVGLDDDITTQMSGKTPGGATSTAGVVTSAPYNKVDIRDLSFETYIEDANGQRVYGRITESAGTWTLTYYTNEAGVETAHSLASTNIRVYYVEVFNQEFRPTFTEEAGFIASLDLTADVVDATSTQRGLVSTGTQSIAGIKTFFDDIVFQESIATEREDVASTAIINSLSSDKTFVKITGVTLTTINGAAAGVNGQILIIYNGTSVDVTVSNQSGSASAANRFVTATGMDVTLEINNSIGFAYDTFQSRWVHIIGSGGGSGGSSTPGGSDTNVQFNDAGTFGGQGDFNFDKTVAGLTIGTSSQANGTNTVGLGDGCIANGDASNAFGKDVTADGNYSHAEGLSTDQGNTGIASGEASHIEGIDCMANGDYSHAEGSETTASGDSAHSEGTGTVASGDYSHAEGNGCTSLSDNCHSEGFFTEASADGAHAEGKGTIANGNFSHAGGDGCTSQGYAQTAIGRFNVLQGTGGSWVSGDDALIIGKGTDNSTRKNAFKVTNDGIMSLYGATSGLFSQTAAVTTTSYSVFWPNAQGAASTVLTNDGSGNLSWAAATASNTAATITLEWMEGANAPVIQMEYDALSALYTSAGSENLYTVIKVPSGYSPGDPLSIIGSVYSPDSSGNILMRMQSTLIRSATDAFSSATNQRTTTNTQLTLSAGTVDEPQPITFDITSASGQINGVAVSAGDQIKIRLYRDTAGETSSATSDARMQIYASEVTFS